MGGFGLFSEFCSLFLQKQTYRICEKGYKNHKNLLKTPAKPYRKSKI